MHVRPRLSVVSIALVTTLVALGGALPARAAIVRVTARQGPYQLQPYQVLYDTSGTRGVRAPRLNGFLVRMHARLVDRRGSPIPVSRIMLHHLVYKDDGRFRGDRHDGTCGGPSESFYGRGEENEHLRLPAGYGVRLRKGDRWHSNWMLMNHSKVVDRAYIQYTAYIDTTSKLTNVKPYWLRVTPCPTRRDPIFDVPGTGAPGSTYTQAIDWTVPQNGRIVAAGSHLHGGATGMSLTQPACGDRTLLSSRALYGPPDHPYYRVWPILHEPGPIATSWMQSRAGLPIRKGDRLRVNAIYDDAQAHMRVMGILHVYVAPARAKAVRGCPALPRDVRALLPTVAGERTYPPAFPLPLNVLDASGRAQPVETLPSPLQSFPGDADISLHDVRATPDHVSVPLGATVRWHFLDPVRHDVTLVNGGEGFSSRQQFGGTFDHRFTTPGTYRLYCSLHPLLMPQEVDVRAGP